MLTSNRLKLNSVSITIYDIIDFIFYKIAEINKLNKLYFEIKLIIIKNNKIF